MEKKTLKLIKGDREHRALESGSFLRLKDGRILYVYVRYRGTGSGPEEPSEVMAITSADGGTTWSRPSCVLKPGKLGCETVSGLSLLRMENGDIGLFFMLHSEPGWVNHICLARSRTEGRTFYRVNKECAFDIYNGYFVLQNDAVIMLSSGRILIPLTYHTGSRRDCPDSHVEDIAYGGFTYSDDDGKTWKTSTDEIYQTFSCTSTGLRHAGAVEIAPDTLRAFWATDMGCQYSSFSTDGALHWTPSEPGRFTSPCSPMKVFKTAEGRFIGVWNPVPDYNGRKTDSSTRGLNTLVLSGLSQDTLRAGEICEIENDASRGFTDAAVFEKEDGSLLLGYSSGSVSEGGYRSRITIREVRP